MCCNWFMECKFKCLTIFNKGLKKMTDQRVVYKMPGDYLIDGQNYAYSIVDENAVQLFLDNSWALTPSEAKQNYEKKQAEDTEAALLLAQEKQAKKEKQIKVEA